MGVLLEIRNPLDLTTSYNQIEIQRNTVNLVAGMADIKTDLAISSTYATDLSTGYSSYTDTDGTIGTHYYRYRYKNTVTSSTASYSDIFLAGSSELQSRFRRMMRDTNSNNFFFNADDTDFFEIQAVQRLWPITWFETYDDTSFVPDNTTEIFNFPIGVTRISGVDFLDSNGNNLGRLVNWNVRGRMLIFDSAPLTGTVLRIWVEKMFIKLSEVPAIWDSHILNLMMLQAYQMLEGDRSAYYKYSSVIKPDGGSLP